MTNYMLTIDSDLWRRVKAKAAAEGSTLRVVLTRLLTAWLNGDTYLGTWRNDR